MKIQIIKRFCTHQLSFKMASQMTSKMTSKIATHVVSKADIRKMAKMVKIFKKDLPKSVRRGLIESTRKSNNFGLNPNGFHDVEADDFFSRKQLKQIEEDIKAWRDVPCVCAEELEYHCSCCYFGCYRCEKLEELGYASMDVGFDSECPTFISELDSSKGANRDGTTWRRKSMRKCLSRVDAKKAKQAHRELLQTC